MRERSTKIVGTLGPASRDEATILSLLEAGMDVARLNFSHGTHDDHALVYGRLRSAAEQRKQALTIFMDMQGPKIRVGRLENGQVELKPDQPLILTTQDLVGNQEVIPVDFPHLIKSVKPGGRILLDDGNLELVAITVEENHVDTRVVLGGILKENKGVNLPGATLDIPGFTEKDQKDLAFGLKLGVDAVAVSFVRSANDVIRVRQAIKSLAPECADTPIIAKMERPEALRNLDSIVKEADGVMVARGDLGVEMSPESVPIAQKRIIDAANRHGKVVITATQMLESMMQNPRPTRAEASDVANAIFDGTDAVMLSGETAAGHYPVQSVETMNAIARQAEAHISDWGHCEPVVEPDAGMDDTYFMTRAARELAQDRNVAAVAAFTKSGRTAMMMSKMRPTVPILAFTPEKRTYGRLNLYWGVHPKLVSHAETIEEMLRDVERVMVSETPLQPGQQVVLICGFPVSQSRPTNLALLHTVGESLD